MKVQFLVTAHRDPALVWRLSERLLAVPDSRVLIQWDRARPVPVVPRALDVEFRVTRRARRDGRRGHSSRRSSTR